MEKDAGKSHRSPSVQLPKLSAKLDDESWDNFLCELYEFGNIHEWQPAQYCAYLPKCLEGEALDVYRLLPKTTRESWQNVLPELARGIQHLQTPEQARQKLAACRQKESEAAGTFMFRLKRLAERAYVVPTVAVAGSWTEEQRNLIIINAFRNGLLPHIHAEVVRRKAENTQLKELQAVVAEVRRLTVIQERLQEHEDFISREAATRRTDTEGTKVQNAAEEAHQMSAMQVPHLGEDLAATQFPAQQHHQIGHAGSYQGRIRYPNSGVRRRIPRKYRIRGARRSRRENREGSEPSQGSSLELTTPF